MLKQPPSLVWSGFVLVLALAAFPGPQAAAQTTTPGTPPAPAAAPNAATPTAPLRNPLNRNPARRASAPQEPPTPTDPRDSTVRPVTPPGSDGRDTVLPAPNSAMPSGAASRPPAPARP